MKTICWDIDDVLNNLMEEWLLSYNLNWGKLIKYEDLKKNPPHEILNVPKEKYLKSLDAFRFFHYLELKPNQKVLEWFYQYGENYNHIALTSTPLNSAHLSAHWLTYHFGKWIRQFVFIPSKREGEYCYPYFDTKGEWLDWFNKVDYSIDDNTENIVQAKKYNLKLNCFCVKQPWNNGDSIVDILKYLLRAYDL